jgi:hypothetical protein
MADGVPDIAGGGSLGVPGQTLERISLVGFKRQNALGFCELQVPSGGVGAARQLDCKIYRPSGGLFATLEEDASGVVGSLLMPGHTSSIVGASTHGVKCWMLTAVASGARFWIKGDIVKRNLVVVNETDKQKVIIHVESGEHLQFKSEDTTYYKLRVQPRIDAGVVIMALLALDRMPGLRRS